MFYYLLKKTLLLYNIISAQNQFEYIYLNSEKQQLSISLNTSYKSSLHIS